MGKKSIKISRSSEDQVDLEKIKRLLDSSTWEDKYIAASLLDRLDPVIFWRFVKNNFNKAGNEYTDYVYDKRVHEGLSGWTGQYIEGRNAYYFLNSRVQLSIDRKKTRLISSNLTVKIFESWIL